MRQVDRDELAYVLASAMRKVSPLVLKQLLDPRPEVHASGRASVGRVMAQALAKHEVMIDAPAPHSPDTFSRPLARMLGEKVVTGAPVICDEPS